MSVRRLFFCLLLCCTFAIAATGAAAEKQHVLLLNSYNQGLTWTDNVVQGVRQVFPSDSPGVELHIEYLDSKRQPIAAAEARLAALLRAKYSTVPLQAIICSDDDALAFLLRQRGDSLPFCPVIFCGINYLPSYGVLPPDEFSGIVENFDIAATLEAALRLQPATRKVLVVNDQSATGRANCLAVRKAASAFSSRLDFSYTGELSLQELQAEIAAQPQDAIILLMSFNVDKNGLALTYDDAIREIYPHAKVPLYGVWDFYLDRGIVGGMLTDGLTQGRLAGEMTQQLLSGMPISQIPTLYDSPNRYMFDDRELRRFALDKDRLPSGSILLNEPVSFYSQYRKLIIGSLTMITILLLIIAILSYNIIERKKALKALSVSEEKFAKAFRHAADCIGIINLQNHCFLEVNEAFIRQLGYTPAELIGRTTLDIKLWENTANRSELYRLLEAERSFSNYQSNWFDHDGKLHRGLCSGEIVEINAQDCLLFIWHDVTEEKRLEDELRDSHAQLEEKVELRTQELTAVNQELRVTNEELENTLLHLKETQDHLVQSEKMAATALLVAGIAHEINTPLGWGLTAATHLQDELQRLNALWRENKLKRSDFSALLLDFDESIASVCRSLNRASLLVRQFKNVAALEPGEGRRRFQLKPYLEMALRDLPQELAARATISLNVPDGLELYSYPGSLAQIVSQLVENALQHAFEEKTGQISIDVCEQENELILTVNDDGCGISAENLPKIFDPFFTTMRNKSPGLGLHIIHNIATQLLSGTLTCESLPGSGSTFKLQIPQQSATS